MSIYNLLNRIKNFFNNEKIIIFLIVVLAIIVRIYYINSISYFENAHDVVPYLEIHGHAGYIYHLLKNNFNILDFNPLDYSQYYHPPLHHLISALFIKIYLKFLNDTNKAFEALQYLTLFYSIVATYIGYFILKELNLKKTSLYIGFLLIAFHPTMIFFAGSINNDCLLLTFNLAIILFSLKWYKNCNLKTMIKCSLLIGLATFTKLSGIIMGIPLLILIIMKFIKEKKLRSKILEDCTISLLICLPFATFWSLWGYFKYSIPISHIQNSGGEQFIVKYFIIDRFLISHHKNFEEILYIIKPSVDFNIPIYLLKTSMFGEWGWSIPKKLHFFAHTLYWSNFCIIILSLFSLFKAFIQKNSINLDVKIYFSSLYLTFIFCYSYFNKLYPYFYTQDYRYIATTLILIPILISFLYRQTKNILLKNIIFILTFIFCISSCIVNTYPI